MVYENREIIDASCNKCVLKWGGSQTSQLQVGRFVRAKGQGSKNAVVGNRALGRLILEVEGGGRGRGSSKKATKDATSNWVIQLPGS